MKIADRAAYYFWLIICCFFMIAILIQSNIFCNTDANWLLHATAKLLNGGKYYQDFFETNPPMILYLNIFPVLLAKFLHLSFGFVFRICVFLLAIFSLLICSILLKKIYQDRPIWMLRIFIIALTYVFIILPVHAFGEREHIALLLTMSYFFLAVLRGNNIKSSIKLEILSGILAGCGFVIKPYFIIPFGLIELYLMFKKRTLFGWVRVEALIILSIFVLYFISIFVVTPEYIIKVMPLVWQFYFSAVGKSYVYILSSIWTIFFLLSIGLFVLLYELVVQRELIIVMLLASTGFVCAYFLQHTAWFYHVLPSYACSLLLIMQLLQEVIFKPIGVIVRYKKIKIFFLILVLITFGIFIPNAIFRTILLHDTLPKVKQIINFIRYNTPNRKVYFFSPSIELPYRIIDKLKIKSVSRFPSQLLLPGLIKQLNMAKTIEQKLKLNHYKQRIIDAVVEDLDLYQPDMIVISDVEHDSLFFPYHFSYIKFFSQDRRFKRIFKMYKKVYSIDNLGFYRKRK